MAKQSEGETGKVKQFVPQPEKLDEELKDRVLDFSDEDVETIKKLYNSWAGSLSNKIIVSGVKGKIVIIGNTIRIGAVQLPHAVTSKTTLHFENCEGSIIKVANKVNHITMVNCNYVTFEISGSISGVDTINCRGIKVVADKHPIYYIDIGKSQDCKYFIQESIGDGTLISCLSCMEIELAVAKGKYGGSTSFMTNKGLLAAQTIFQFNIKDRAVKLFSMNAYGPGEVRATN